MDEKRFTDREVHEIHGALEWSEKGESGERYVTLSSRAGFLDVFARGAHPYRSLIGIRSPR